MTDAPGTGADHRADPVLLRWASRRREFEAIQAQRDIALQLQRLADAIERLVGVVRIRSGGRATHRPSLGSQPGGGDGCVGEAGGA